VPDEFALNRCPAVLIRSEEVERFQRTYLSLFVPRPRIVNASSRWIVQLVSCHH
jgi:hypothetical protein